MFLNTVERDQHMVLKRSDEAGHVEVGASRSIESKV
jgi:hypothetical protein